MFPSEDTIGRIYMDEFEIPDNELEGTLALFQVKEVDGQTYLLWVIVPSILFSVVSILILYDIICISRF
jgi:hypothetical protein